MRLKYKLWEARRQIVFATDQEDDREATVSFSPDGELISVDDEKAYNHYIGLNMDRAKEAIKKVLGIVP